MYTRSFKNDRSRKFLFKSSRPKGGGRFNSLNRGQKRGSGGERIDPAKFINKAVMAEGVDTFRPEHKFQDFKIDQRLKQIVAARGYKTPTPIQDRVIPHAISGFDIIGVANTGTGN